ncbi:MAG: sulfatase-like hydrolase/transferase [Planctomycetota bacterium]|jgi:choline-sulfatase|nr:sulfatase-like hydrolase/transferase [Planctomycetota bacterium]MDP7131001.1 sulfatase-like hydrolase/transferase [Planctomycetota bacterium]MDP7254549.1 sulfatase-like hydrolase/transferase [Planctomycetota bacterium]
MNTKPNILLIMDDQHRFDYLGCAGADFIQTPNIDRLAARGMRFTNCCVNAPVCAPMRVALATGLEPHRFGGTGNNVFLPLSRRTYYQRLRDVGYRVGCCGKLDLAKPAGKNSDGARPPCFAWGFTHPIECEGKMHAGQGGDIPFGPYSEYLHSKGMLQKFSDDYSRRRASNYALSAWDSVLDTEDFEDTYIGRRSASWIDEIRDDYPWHMYVSFVGPHDPFDPPTEYADKYRNAEMPPPIRDSLEGKPRTAHARQVGATDDQILDCRRQYCAATTLIDDQVGAIIDAVEGRGMLDNTYIVFSSDHGEMLGDHGMFTKSVPYESSLRVPLIVAGPGIEGGQVSDAIVELIDVNATICDLAGLGPQEAIDARSFRPVLEAGTDEHRQEALSTLRHFRCIRTKRWKYVENENDITELYDLGNDPSELNNKAEEETEVLREMRGRLGTRLLEGQWNR